LAQILTSLDKKQTRPGDTWAWFVTVFCQRTHGTKNTAGIAAPAGFHQPKKNPSHESRESNFTGDLLQQVGEAVHRL
jgi:hypothetical protein